MIHSNDELRQKAMEINISIDDDTFSEDELKKLTRCIREIEQNKPERHVNIWIDSPEKSIDEMKRIISSIRPKFPYQKVIELEKNTK